MDETHLRSMLESLREQGRRSEYMDRLQRRLNVATGRSSLEAEILSEMAASLGRAEDKINLALLDLETLGAQLDAAERGGALPPDYEATLARFNQRREDALLAREYLLIQREAIGLRQNDQLPRIYPVPPRRARRQGS